MTTTLLLNASYEPLRVIPLRRAVLLVLNEKAEIVHEGEGKIRSASTSFPMPKVVRLLRMVRVPYRSKIPLNRRAVIARDHGLCQYCFKSGDTIDHVVPRSRGGKHEWTNVVTACKRCNAAKADKMLKELGWTLQTKPYSPTGTSWIVIAVARIDESWEPYLSVGAAPVIV